MRTVDDVANDFANAEDDSERARLIREMDAMNEEIAAAHLKQGHASEYQWMIGKTRQQNRGVSADAARVRARMERSEFGVCATLDSDDVAWGVVERMGALATATVAGVELRREYAL